MAQWYSVNSSNLLPSSYSCGKIWTWRESRILCHRYLLGYWCCHAEVPSHLLLSCNSASGQGQRGIERPLQRNKWYGCLSKHHQASNFPKGAFDFVAFQFWTHIQEHPAAVKWIWNEWSDSKCKMPNVNHKWICQWINRKAGAPPLDGDGRNRWAIPPFLKGWWLGDGLWNWLYHRILTSIFSSQKVAWKQLRVETPDGPGRDFIPEHPWA